MGAMNRGPGFGNMDDNYRIIDRLDLGFSKIGEFQSVCRSTGGFETRVGRNPD